MVVINYNSREVSCKIVFYGPGLSGKTTNLQYIHGKVPGKTKGDLISLATDADRTLYFDFLPINIGDINGFATKFQLYTVPGQVFYNATRKLVLRGVDGIIFVADSQTAKAEENVESLNNLKENLIEYGVDLKNIPFVLQYNKRDLPDVMTVDELNKLLNDQNWPIFEASATRGKGVFDTLKFVIKMILDKARSSPETMEKMASPNMVEDAQLPPENAEPPVREEKPIAASHESAEPIAVESDKSSQEDKTVSISKPSQEPEPTAAVQPVEEKVNLAASAAPAKSSQGDALVGKSISSVVTRESAPPVEAEKATKGEETEVATATVQMEHSPRDIEEAGAKRIPVVAEDQVEPVAEESKQEIEEAASTYSQDAETPAEVETSSDSDNNLYHKLSGIGEDKNTDSIEEIIEPIGQDVFSVPTMQESLRLKRKKKRGFFLFRLFRKS